jgi:hypothetical protein
MTRRVAFLKKTCIGRNLYLHLSPSIIIQLRATLEGINPTSKEQREFSIRMHINSVKNPQALSRKQVVTHRRAPLSNPFEISQVTTCLPMRAQAVILGYPNATFGYPSCH